MSGWSTRSCAIVIAVAAGVLTAGCGGGARQDAQEPSGIFHVQVAAASFPSSQTLAQHTHLVISVRNMGTRTIPDIAVTITDPRYGTAIKAFSQYLNMPGLASHSRPVWVVDRPPATPSEPGGCGYSCEQGGAGGAATAYANTWALGQLKPGQTAKFVWALTAVSPGMHQVHYVVAAGLNGKAKARLVGGAIPEGTFTVKISGKPAQAYVSNSGQIVTTK